MSWINSCINLVFPSEFSDAFLTKIPPAPEPPHQYIFALYDYQNYYGKKLVYTIKKRQERSLSKKIAQRLCNLITEYLSEQNMFGYFKNPIIIPVPLFKKDSHRDFNQIELISKYFANAVNGSYQPECLIKNIATQKQARISKKKKRFQNVKNAFSVPEKYRQEIAGEDIIIVDDLVTTGATLLEIRKVLLVSGARNVIGITIAH